MAAIGMMEGAYFVGRVELLNWLNDLLKLDYTKVEQVCSAAAFCQIMDAIHPGQVPLHKVNFSAKQEYEYINNFKVLQSVFDKYNIDKAIDVPKLVKGKYQDNLEFLQWIKKYYDLNNPGTEYNAIERRKQASGGKVSVTATKPSTTSVKTTGVAKVPSKVAPTKVSPAPAKNLTTGTTKSKVTAVTSKETTQKDDQSNQKISELNTQVAELKLTIDGLEKERDFYFGKLRGIEILCQNADQSSELTQSILRILYSTDEQQEFVTEETAPQEDQQVQEEEQQEPQQERSL